MMKNNKGLTIIEITVGLGVAAILGFITLQFIVDHQKQSRRIEKAIDYKVDTLLADKVLLKDFRLAFPSVNQLNVLDSNNKLFFEQSDKILGDPNSTENGRLLRLDRTNYGNKSLHVLIQDTTRGEILYAEPILFYDIGAPTDINSPAPLTFNVNKLKNYINAKNSLMLEAGSLVFIDSSSPMPVTTHNPLGRYAAFLAIVNNSGYLEIFNPPGSIFNFKIYSKNADGSELETVVSTVDQFLKELPPSSNGGSTVRIVPVRLIKYSLSCRSELTEVSSSRADLSEVSGRRSVPIIAPLAPSTCKLMRGEYLNGSQTNIRTVIDDVISVTFNRKNILSTITNVTFEKPQKSNN